jgi:hypothetical protein
LTNYHTPLLSVDFAFVGHCDSVSSSGGGISSGSGSNFCSSGSRRSNSGSSGGACSSSSIVLSLFLFTSCRPIESGRIGVCGKYRPKFVVTLASETENQSTAQPS